MTTPEEKEHAECEPPAHFLDCDCDTCVQERHREHMNSMAGVSTIKRGRTGGKVVAPTTPLDDIRTALAEEIDRHRRQLAAAEDDAGVALTQYQNARQRYGKLVEDHESLCRAEAELEGIARD